jgi:GT2 family glycosyltransferase
MTFSVIVPTYNRINLLKNTLASLYKQDFSDFEIIVVNDGSTDSTHEYLSSAAEEGKVAYLHHPNQGLAATRSAGLKIARGKFIAFTDDDCVLPPNWLSQYHAKFESENAVCVGGNCITGNPENPCAEANDVMQSYFKEKGNDLGIPFFTGNNVAYAHSVLLEVGGPDKKFRMGAEDRDLLERVSSTGGKIVYAPNITVTHFNDSDFSRFVRHQFEFGEGSYLYYSVQRSRSKKRSAFPLSAYLGVFLAPFKNRTGARAIRLILLIVVAQMAVTAGYIRQYMVHMLGSTTVFAAA